MLNFEVATIGNRAVGCVQQYTISLKKRYTKIYGPVKNLADQWKIKPTGPAGQLKKQLRATPDKSQAAVVVTTLCSAFLMMVSVIIYS